MKRLNKLTHSEHGTEESALWTQVRCPSDCSGDAHFQYTGDSTAKQRGSCYRHMQIPKPSQSASLSALEGPGVGFERKI